MELREGYKRTEVGVIPESWGVKSLESLIHIKNGFAFSRTYFSNTGPIVLTPGNFKLEGGLYFNHRNVKRYSGSFPNAYRFDIGDLLIVMTDLTPDCNLLGKPAFVERNNLLHNQRIGKIVPIEKEQSINYLYCFFNSDAFNKRMKETATGSTVRHTSVGSIYRTLVPLPPTKTEQIAIANALSDADALIQSLTRLIAKKCQIKQGTMQCLLNPYADGRLKAGWVVKKLGDLLRIGHGKSQREVIDENGNYPILASGGEIGRANQYLYDKPSVLIGRKGTIDVPQYMDKPFWTIDTLFYTEIFKPNNAKYLFYQFNLIDWYSYNEASGVPSLSAKTIEEIELTVPAPQEQTRIATILSDMDTDIAALETKLAKTRQIKQGMMQNLLTGRIRLI